MVKARPQRAAIILTNLVAAVLIAVYCSTPTVAAEREGDGKASANDVDLRGVFEQFELSDRKQGKRNTCSVFAVVSAMEYAVALQQQRSERLSIEYLNWASNQELGKWQDGSFFSDIWVGYQRHGICPEREMPYDASAYDAKRVPSALAGRQAKQTAADLQLHWIKHWDPNKGLSEKQLAEVKATLDRGWPVCGGFLWPRRASWPDGVLNHPPREGVRDGHSVLLVGYRQDPSLPGGGVFLLRDSGGGRRGGLMSFAYALDYMNDAVWIDYEGAPSQAPSAQPLKQTTQKQTTQK